MVRIVLDLPESLAGNREWEFCVDVLSDAGHLIAKLWVTVVQR